MGVAGGAQFRAPGSDAPLFSPWGNFQAWLVNTLKGQDDNGFIIQIKTGSAYHHTMFLSQGQVRFGIGEGKFCLNPEALLPLMESKVSMALGFGLEYRPGINTQVWINGVSSSDIMDAYYYGNLEYKMRRLIPFITCGPLIHTNGPFSVQLIFRANLQDTFYKNETLDLGSGAGPFSLEHQPLIFNLAVLYRFSKA